VLEDNQINKKESENIAVINFNDGYKDNYVYAYLILKHFFLSLVVKQYEDMYQNLLNIKKALI